MQLFVIVSTRSVTAEGFDEVVDPRAVWDKVFLVDDDSFGVSSLVDDLIWSLCLLRLFFFSH